MLDCGGVARQRGCRGHCQPASACGGPAEGAGRAPRGDLAHFRASRSIVYHLDHLAPASVPRQNEEMTASEAGVENSQTGVLAAVPAAAARDYRRRTNCDHSRDSRHRPTRAPARHPATHWIIASRITCLSLGRALALIASRTASSALARRRFRSLGCCCSLDAEASGRLSPRRQFRTLGASGVRSCSRPNPVREPLLSQATNESRFDATAQSEDQASVTRNTG
jgi:hypothetical protein